METIYNQWMKTGEVGMSRCRCRTKPLQIVVLCRLISLFIQADHVFLFFGCFVGLNFNFHIVNRIIAFSH